MSNAVRTQHWSQSLTVGELGVELALDFLESLRRNTLWYQTVCVLTLADDQSFQQLGIDIVWFVAGAGCTCAMTVEVKADKNEHTGNFFFETVSDLVKGSIGAFLCSTAEWYFYVFPGSYTIYCLPLNETRRWFFENESRFAVRTARSSRGRSCWQTQGSLVPVVEVWGCVPGVRVFKKRQQEWMELTEVKVRTN